MASRMAQSTALILTADEEAALPSAQAVYPHSAGDPFTAGKVGMNFGGGWDF